MIPISLILNRFYDKKLLRYISRLLICITAVYLAMGTAAFRRLGMAGGTRKRYLQLPVSSIIYGNSITCAVVWPILNVASILAEQQTLFLNVDANILEDQEFHRGTSLSTSDRALPADPY